MPKKKKKKNRLNYTHYFIIKIPNKRELQQIAFNYSSDIDFKDFIFYKKCIAKPYSFLVIDGTIASDIPKHFRKNFSERTEKLVTTIDNKISDENLQYNINRKAAKISTLSSGKIYKHEYLTRVEVLPKRRVVEQAKFTYSPLGKDLQEKLRINEKHYYYKIVKLTLNQI